jgi:hypothetical protein
VQVRGLLIYVGPQLVRMILDSVVDRDCRVPDFGDDAEASAECLDV